MFVIKGGRSGKPAKYIPQKTCHLFSEAGIILVLDKDNTKENDKWENSK